jgi:hypothetical protein
MLDVLPARVAKVPAWPCLAPRRARDPQPRGGSLPDCARSTQADPRSQKTTVVFPSRKTLSSQCHFTARAKTVRSISAPCRVSPSTVSR